VEFSDDLRTTPSAFTQAVVVTETAVDSGVGTSHDYTDGVSPSTNGCRAYRVRLVP
jgi:hypothetical protein